MLKEFLSYIFFFVLLFVSLVVFCCFIVNGYDGLLFGIFFVNKDFKVYFDVFNVGIGVGIVIFIYQIGSVVVIFCIGFVIDIWGCCVGMCIGVSIIVFGVVI